MGSHFSILSSSSSFSSWWLLLCCRQRLRQLRAVAANSRVYFIHLSVVCVRVCVYLLHALCTFGDTRRTRSKRVRGVQRTTLWSTDFRRHQDVRACTLDLRLMDHFSPAIPATATVAKKKSAVRVVLHSAVVVRVVAGQRTGLQPTDLRRTSA